MTALIFPLIILGAGGNWQWVEGWLFALWFDVMVLANMTYLYLQGSRPAGRTAEASRLRQSERVGRGDAAAASTWSRWPGWSSSPSTLPVSLVAGVPDLAEGLGGLLLLPALYLIQRATMENTYLSTLVRIQDDRGHRVVSTGVYGFVRHPLYLGCLLMMLGGPLLVGSVAGLLITALADRWDWSHASLAKSGCSGRS